jgi:hypothetical protein
MSRIRIPGDELAEVIELLRRIRERLERTASLESVGTEDDVGDGRLRGAVQHFDGRWRAGQERVRENTDTFIEIVDSILANFADTDAQISQQIDGDG